MKEKVRFLGLDVHAETIAVAIAEPDGEVRSLGTIANRAESIRKLVKKLGPVEQLKACYEAGPTGYVLYWQLAELGVACEVIAPTLVPMKAGDRVKTDRRDAERLARSYRSGDLTAVWVPDEGSEALRDLVRAREAAKQDQLRARHRLSKFLLRTGRRPAAGMKAWTASYMAWVRQLRFAQWRRSPRVLDYLHEVEHMGERVARLEQAITEAVKLASPAVQEVVKGLQALRGIAEISAVTIAAELGNITRFDTRAAVDGLQRRGSQRELQRGTNAARQHHQDRQRASATHRRRSSLELSAAARHRPALAQATRRSAGRDQGDRLEGAGPAAQTLRQAGGGRQGPDARSSPPWGANCWASSGPSGSRRKRQPSSRWRPDEVQEQKQRQKQKLSKE